MNTNNFKCSSLARDYPANWPSSLAAKTVFTNTNTNTSPNTDTNANTNENTHQNPNLNMNTIQIQIFSSSKISSHCY